MTDGTDDLMATAARAMADIQHPIKVQTAAWAAQTLAQEDLVTADRECRFSLADWQACADQGIFGLLVPEEFGGAETDIVTALLTLEGLGQGCRDNGLGFAVVSQICSTQIAITRFGSQEQKARWLPGMCDGSILGGFAITEPNSGSDAYAMAGRAVLHGDHYRISCHKAHITLGSRADVVVVFASTNPEAKGWGISAFLVPTDLAGVTIGPNREKMGMRTTPFGDVVLDDVEVPVAARLGPEGVGPAMFSNAMEAERAFVFATQIGAMERQLDTTVAYARDRLQSDRPIGSYQAVSHRIADMKLRHETARLFLYRSAIDTILGRPSVLSASLTKLAVSESWAASSLDAIRVHGARGYITEYEIERDLRDAAGGLIYSGTSDIQRNVIARLLGLG